MPYLCHAEIVSDKNSRTYTALLGQRRQAAGALLMVGEPFAPTSCQGSAPGRERRLRAVPHHMGVLIAEPPPAGQRGFYEPEHIGLLPGLLRR